MIFRAWFSSAQAPILRRSANIIHRDLLTALTTYSVIVPTTEGSAVAKAVCRALPLCNTVGNHARRLHGGLAKLSVARNLSLDPLTFRMKQFAKAFEFRN